MFVFGISEKNDWFFTPTFFVYQKVNKGVYCYISKAMGFYVLQLYERGTTNFCTLEARSENIERLFDLGERWLQQYQNYPLEEIQQSPYFIGNPHWRNVCWV